MARPRSCRMTLNEKNSFPILYLQVIDPLHQCMEDMIDYMAAVEHRVEGIAKLTHLCWY